MLPTPHPPSLVLLAMTTTTQETHYALRSIMQEMHNTLGSMVANMLKIDTEQQVYLYNLEVMAGIRLTVVKPPLLSTSTPMIGTSVPPSLPCTPSPQPEVWLEPPPSEAGGATKVDAVKATFCGPKPRRAPPHASLTVGAIPICGPELPPMPPLSALTGITAACCFNGRRHRHLRAQHQTIAADFCPTSRRHHYQMRFYLDRNRFNQHPESSITI
jgi:hypothetical protein